MNIADAFKNTLHSERFEPLGRSEMPLDAQCLGPASPEPDRSYLVGELWSYSVPGRVLELPGGPTIR